MQNLNSHIIYEISKYLTIHSEKALLITDKESYNSSDSYNILDKEEVLNVISTYPLDNSTLLIESLIDNNQVDFELNFENSGFTGTAGGYYDLGGEKIE